MSNNERTGTRDLTYSRAHRPTQLSPLIVEAFGVNRARAQMLADACTVVDIDWAEYCKWCKQTLALIETVRGPTPKSAGVTTGLAREAGKRAFSIAYQADDEGNLTGVAVQELWPRQTDVRRLTPVEWSIWLVDLHICHTCDDQPEWVDRARELPYVALHAGSYDDQEAS